MSQELCDYRAAIAVELQNAAHYRRSLQRGLMARFIALPAIRDSLAMAKRLNVSLHILRQV